MRLVITETFRPFEPFPFIRMYRQQTSAPWASGKGAISMTVATELVHDGQPWRDCACPMLVVSSQCALVVRLASCLSREFTIL